MVKSELLLVYIFSYVAAPLGYSLRVLYSRTLPLDDMGLIWSIVGLVSIFCTINDLGFAETLKFYGPRFFQKNEYGKLKATLYYTLYMQLLISALVATLLFFIAPFLADYYFQSKKSLNVFKIFISYMLFYNITYSFSAIFVALHKYYLISLCEAIRLLVTTLLSLIAIFYLGNKLEMIALSWAISAFIVYVISYIYAKTKYKEIFLVKADFSWNLYKQLWRYAIPVILGSCAMILIGKIDVSILTALSTLSDVAIYSNVLSVSQIILYLLTPISNIFTPLVSKLSITEKNNEIIALFEKFFTIGIFITIPILIMILTYPDEIILLMFGDKYISGRYVLVILAISCYLIYLATLPIGIVTGLGHVNIKTKVLYIAALSHLILCIILTYSIGMMGAAIANLVSSSLILVLLLIYSIKMLKYNIFKHNKIYHVKLMSAVTIFTGVITVLKRVIEMNIIAKSILIYVIAIFIYLIFSLLIKLITIKDIKNAVVLTK